MTMRQYLLLRSWMVTVKRLPCRVKGQIGVDDCLALDAGSPFSRMPSFKQKAGYAQHTNPFSHLVCAHIPLLI